MALRSALHHPVRSAALPTLAGLLVIGGVIGANFYSMWYASPQLVPLEPLERLSALQAGASDADSAGGSASALPANALAAQPNGSLARADGIAAFGGAGSNGAASPAPTRLTDPATAAAAASTLLSRSRAVESGEGLSTALQALQVQGETQRAVIAAYSQLRKPEHLQAGWRLWGRFASASVIDSGSLQSLVIAPASGEGVTVERQSDGSYLAKEGGLPGTLQRQAIRCGIVGSLEASLRRCGEGDSLIAQLQVLLTDRLALPAELQPGDELRLVVDKLMDGDTVVRYVDIAALDIRSVTGQRTVAIHFSEADGRGAEGYYDLQGGSIERMFLRQPLRVGRATSGFGMRIHPILHKLKAHQGLDFGAPRGTAVYAAADGVLIAARKAGAAGNLVRVRHSEGYMTEYMHLQKFGTVTPGQRVTKGDVIGYVGTTGRSTGPHLHLGVRKGGTYLDPMQLGDVMEPGVASRSVKAFQGHAADLLRLLDALSGAKGST